jgi:phage terminase large subunit
MQFQITTATNKLLDLRKRIRGVSGGTSASKTISILLWLIDCAQSHDDQMISVVSETLPHLKRGAIRDFTNIMEDRRYWKPARWNKSDFTYTFETGSRIEFFSADQPGKVRGPRRDVLFINEANNIPLETFEQLEVRTRKVIWLDWNPVAEFWWYTDIIPNELMDVDFITLTYLDNEGLEQSIIESIESRKGNKNWWQVYGLGQLGEAEGRIFTDWQLIDEIPHEAKLERYGLDFGYSNDPTALVGVYRYNNGLILDEVAYQKKLLNSDIAGILSNVPRALVIADSAEPKSIDELKTHAISVLASTKGQGSVLQGIQAVQDQRISVTKRSINLIKEYRNYLWETDKEGKIINEPSPILNHAMDALRYAIASLAPKETYSPQYKPSKWSIK